ncbi:MAG TPA: sodium/proline symporter [Polyangiaceae bacterium LLY-WYZ-15_(1-7)]|nr:sodium:proline symporter [Myxococcales bacterium]MAT28889.1 sodium:proline symporter [Sandaracinus sp.]HJK93606.1 sodium/proline symporter [Polyangiaceae bacterium LLY-WYZ-15_(1-7)]MBJ70689.1 sodium:proline symporter [Sandaracinus sp.]HJL01743.1 sodium/proline symporter [Polyangiaceae bacterium LLY-WYZ-15_(1-7)]
MVAASFLFFLLAFTVIGIASVKGKEADTPEDYLVANRNVKPGLAALSAVATNNSGFMFVGLIGFAYGYGVQAVWLHAGWVAGDILVWIRAHRVVRERSGDLEVSSVPALLATDDQGRLDRVLATVAGLLTFFFLAGYAAAQLNAGSTALHTLFDWDLRVGAILGAIIVVLYSFSGGIRASIWTDVAQAIVMLIAMVVLLGSAMAKIPLTEIGQALRAEDPMLVQWVPDDLTFGLSLYVLGFVFGGLGILGQPHILVRSMSVNDPKNMGRARNAYFLWYIPFSVAAVLVGLYARLLVPDLESMAAVELVEPAELALPELASRLLPDVLVGLSLAGLFSATMSTADSQILSCSAAVTQDIAPRWKNSYLASKIATVTVTGLALTVALTANEGVFSLVLIAWSALGATLGPLMILRLAGRPIRTGVAILMMGSGLATVIIWDALGHSGAMFKLLPGMAVPFLIYGLSPLITRDRGHPKKKHPDAAEAAKGEPDAEAAAAE